MDTARTGPVSEGPIGNPAKQFILFPLSQTKEQKMHIMNWRPKNSIYPGGSAENRPQGTSHGRHTAMDHLGNRNYLASRHGSVEFDVPEHASGRTHQHQLGISLLEESPLPRGNGNLRAPIEFQSSIEKAGNPRLFRPFP